MNKELWHVAQVINGCEDIFAAKCSEFGGQAIVFKGLTKARKLRGKKPEPKPFIIFQGYVFFKNCYARKQWQCLRAFYDAVSQTTIDAIQRRVESGEFDEAAKIIERIGSYRNKTIQIKNGFLKDCIGVVYGIENDNLLVKIEAESGTITTRVHFNDVDLLNQLDKQNKSLVKTKLGRAECVDG